MTGGNANQTAAPSPRKAGKTKVVEPQKIGRDRLQHIPEGQTVLLELPSGNFKNVKLSARSRVDLGKFGTFNADDLIGLPFGLTYEIEDVEPPAGVANGSAGKRKTQTKLKAVVNTTLAELQETDATNEFIHDDAGASQALTYVDIKELKESGTSSRELIDLVTASSSSFAQRTVYSQDKFKRRKAQKHLKLFTPFPPSAHNICSWQFAKDPQRIRGFRIDSLAQMLNLGDVRSGGRYMVVDDTSGLLTGAVLERMGGEGTLLLIHDADSPPSLDLVHQMGISEAVLKATLRVVNWAQTDKDWKKGEKLRSARRLLRFGSDALTLIAADLPTELESLDTDGKKVNTRDIIKLRRRRAGFEALDAAREDFFSGDFDGLLMSTQYDAWSIVQRLYPLLAGSASIVAHGPFQHPLMELLHQMRNHRAFINTSVTEPWLRRYQVLPGRMHPEMNTSATGGFLLHSHRVFGEDLDATPPSGEQATAAQGETNGDVKPEEA